MGLVRNPKGTLWAVPSICATDGASPPSPCRANVTSGYFASPSGRGHWGVQVQAAPNEVVIGVTPIPGGGSATLNGSSAQYVWPRWSTGRRDVRFVVATVTPTRTPIATRTLTPTPTLTPGPAAQYTARVPIQQWVDDAEEAVSDGQNSRGNGDLDLTNDPYWLGPQIIGLRFQGVPVPPGSTITRAYIEFTATKARSGATSLLFQAEATDNAAVMEWAPYNISDRPRTSASIAWDNVPAWTTVGGVHRTPDLASLVQEVVSRPGWLGGNALFFVVSGTGQRDAATYDRNPAEAPVLVIEYSSIRQPEPEQALLSGIPVDEPLFLPLIGR